MPPVLSKLPVMISQGDIIDKRYENSLIYILKHKTNKDCGVYIGSTINFKMSYYYHKSSCNSENSVNFNQLKYKYIRENGGWDNWEMIKIEDYPCKNLKELMIREDEIMSKYKNRINVISSIWTTEKRKKGYDSYNYKNKEKRKEAERERYKNKKEEINKYRSEKIICDNCGIKLTRNHIARHKKSERCLEHKNKKSTFL